MNLQLRHVLFSRGAAFLAGYIALYGLMLGLLARYQGYDPTEALFVLAVFGVAFPSLGWALTRGLGPAAIDIPRPGWETALVCAYLALFAFGVLGYGFTWLRDHLPDARAHELAVFVVKLVTMVLLPALLLRLAGHRLGSLLRWDLRLRDHGLVLAGLGGALLLFEAVFGQGLKTLGALQADIGALTLGAPLCLLWLAIDTGLTEEFLFRVVIQTRLSAWLRSETAGVVVMALLFGIAHAPGYYLRNAFAAEGSTASPSLLMCVGYAVVVTSTTGFLFGVVWARTRSLVLVSLLHALNDLLPNLADFIRDWLR